VHSVFVMLLILCIPNLQTHALLCFPPGVVAAGLVVHISMVYCALRAQQLDFPWTVLVVWWLAQLLLPRILLWHLSAQCQKEANRQGEAKSRQKPGQPSAPPRLAMKSTASSLRKQGAEAEECKPLLANTSLGDGYFAVGNGGFSGPPMSQELQGTPAHTPASQPLPWNSAQALPQLVSSLSSTLGDTGSDPSQLPSHMPPQHQAGSSTLDTTAPSPRSSTAAQQAAASFSMVEPLLTQGQHAMGGGANTADCRHRRRRSSSSGKGTSAGSALDSGDGLRAEEGMGAASPSVSPPPETCRQSLPLTQPAMPRQATWVPMLQAGSSYIPARPRPRVKKVGQECMACIWLSPYHSQQIVRQIV
jgi:hypothetical protein